MFPTFMYKHYYMKQYNCVFCAFPLLSVCLTSFAPILTTNENWILFLAFLKIMWTIFGCKWHFPSRDTTYDIEHDKKECQERRNWSRRIKVSQEDGQNWSCGSISVFVCIFWTNDLICIIVKTWENISSLFSLNPRNFLTHHYFRTEMESSKSPRILIQRCFQKLCPEPFLELERKGKL